MTTEIVIDLNQAGLELEPAALEAYCLGLVAELRSDLAEDARLLRQDELPEGAMSGLAAFVGGVLKAEVNAKNIGKVLGWLWHLRPTAVQKITYKKEGREVVLEYQTPEQLNQQIGALKQIDGLFTVQLIQTK